MSPPEPDAPSLMDRLVRSVSGLDVFDLIRRLLCCAVISACGAGGPPVRSNANDGGGPLLPNCQNLHPDPTDRPFITEFYLSTWGSAWVEGAVQGVSEGLQTGGVVRSHVDPAGGFRVVDRPRGVLTTTLPVAPEPYCRIVAAPARDVRVALEALLTSVGRPVVAWSGGGARFETSFAHASHRAARWYDKYTITVEPLGRDTSAVRVLRLLFISRDRTVYNQAYSSGHNESWLIDAAERKSRFPQR
jgi:hypothetical protein